MLSIINTQHNSTRYYAEIRPLFLAMLNVVLLYVIMLSVVLLYVIMLGVFMLSVILQNVIMMSVVVQSIIMLSVILLSAIMLNVIMLSVMGFGGLLHKFQCQWCLVSASTNGLSYRQNW